MVAECGPSPSLAMALGSTFRCRRNRESSLTSNIPHSWRARCALRHRFVVRSRTLDLGAVARNRGLAPHAREWPGLSPVHHQGSPVKLKYRLCCADVIAWTILSYGRCENNAYQDGSCVRPMLI